MLWTCVEQKPRKRVLRETLLESLMKSLLVGFLMESLLFAFPTLAIQVIQVNWAKLENTLIVTIMVLRPCVIYEPFTESVPFLCLGNITLTFIFYWDFRFFGKREINSQSFISFNRRCASQVSFRSNKFGTNSLTKLDLHEWYLCQYRFSSSSSFFCKPLYRPPCRPPYWLPPCRPPCPTPCQPFFFFGQHVHLSVGHHVHLHVGHHNDVRLRDADSMEIRKYDERSDLPTYLTKVGARDACASKDQLYMIRLKTRVIYSQSVPEFIIGIGTGTYFRYRSFWVTDPVLFSVPKFSGTTQENGNSREFSGTDTKFSGTNTATFRYQDFLDRDVPPFSQVPLPGMPMFQVDSKGMLQLKDQLRFTNTRFSIL